MISKELGTLHRYFIWSDQMRIHYDELLKRGKFDINSENGILTILYMSYWYAGLYVAIEGWREMDFKDQNIDLLLKSKNVDLLKKYRNGVFHFQKKYWDNRFINFVKNGDQPAQWVRNLRNELSRFFLDQFDNKE